MDCSSGAWMSVVVSTNIKPTFNPQQVVILLDRIGSTLVRMIRTRVQQQGLNVNEEEMRAVTPYSAQYAAFKQHRAVKAAKRYNTNTAKAKDTALKVNMTLTGRMMQALKVVRKSYQNGIAAVEVGWTGAQYEKAAHNQERREFFGVSDTEQQAVDKVVNDMADEIAKGVL